MGTLDLTDLDRLYATPSPRAVAKAIDHIDPHAARFISLSPFCVFATSGSDHTVDASPRGGEPGFIKVADRKRLHMPDRPGNNRLDSLRNILGSSGEIAMIFFIPGIDDTLRVNGRATLSTEAALLSSMIEFGKLPRAVVEISVREAYLHCPKALMRSKLWSAEVQIKRSELPSLGQMIRDQTGLGEATPTEIAVETFKQQL
jgi:PPOX class probable FMN-dependent enzyme